jgi:hypothetical protein
MSEAPLFHPSFFEGMTNTDSETIPKLPKTSSGGGPCANNSGAISTLYDSTPLILAYFSNKNINNLQNLLRYNIYQEIKMVVDKQSRDELVAVMQSIYIMNARHPQLPQKRFTKALQKEYTMELLRLNEITIRRMLPHVISAIQQHVDYIRDITNPASRMYLDKPISDNIKGERQYPSVTKIFTGME